MKSDTTRTIDYTDEIANLYWEQLGNAKRRFNAKICLFESTSTTVLAYFSNNERDRSNNGKHKRRHVDENNATPVSVASIIVANDVPSARISQTIITALLAA